MATDTLTRLPSFPQSAALEALAASVLKVKNLEAKGVKDGRLDAADSAVFDKEQAAAIVVSSSIEDREFAVTVTPALRDRLTINVQASDDMGGLLPADARKLAAALLVFAEFAESRGL